MNAQQETWAGSFGDAYTERNRVNWVARIPFWTHILAKTGADSAFELGANVGWNLLAIRTVKPIPVTGCDVNVEAVMQARNLGLAVHQGHYAWTAHLVFTAGVLIHLATEELEHTMRQIVGASMRWVLAIEYAAEQEEEIEYRGQKGLLWKRPYGELYERMGLKLVETGEAQGFDRCHYWLLEP